MTARTVLFGATGYTGRLTARSLVDAGVHPVLAGRDRVRLDVLNDELGGGLTTLVADAAEPDGAIAELLEPGDVLISTVGPFVQLGEPAVRAAVQAGAHYLDSTGEPAFIRRVFDAYGPRAAGRSVLLPAFGFDFVPGNLAAGLVVRAAADRVTRVEVGYLFTGAGARAQASSGTLATSVGIALTPSHAWRGGRLIEERSAARTRGFRTVDGRVEHGVAVGGTEHLSVPDLEPRVEDVGVYVGPAPRLTWLASAPVPLLRRVPGGRQVVQTLSRRLARTTGEGPDPQLRDRTGFEVVAEAYDAQGTQLARVHLEGPNAYTFTGDVLAWGARRLAADGAQVTGAAGPVQAFGLDVLAAAARELGLRPVATSP